MLSFGTSSSMSTVAPVFSTSGPVISHENLLLDYPEADIILRSRDSYEFRLLKLYIVHSSLILGQEVLLSSLPHDTSDLEREGATSADALRVVELPLTGAILFSLLTYIFPVPPVIRNYIAQLGDVNLRHLEIIKDIRKSS